MKRLVAALLALFAAWLAGASTAIAAVPPAPAAVYAYDSHHHAAVIVTPESERGPPATFDLHTTYDPVAARSHGASVRSAGVTPRATTAYGHPTPLSPVARATVSSKARVQVHDGDSVAVGRSRVAANAAPKVPAVVFSRSRAPGIANTFDNAVANGAPTRLNRVTGATRDANRRAALRGQPPAPAGQSLDEYPFACSAQGGCGSFVNPVPIADGERR